MQKNAKNCDKAIVIENCKETCDLCNGVKDCECNPKGKAGCDEKGKCKCLAGYTGDDCYDCEGGYYIYQPGVDSFCFRKSFQSCHMWHTYTCPKMSNESSINNFRNYVFVNIQHLSSYFV